MSENENVVTERICKIVHKGVDDKFCNVEEKFESLDQCMKEIREAVQEMKVIAAGNKEIIQILLEERKARSEEKTEKPQKESFWNTKAGQIVPIAAAVVIVFIVAALVGTNLIEATKAATQAAATIK